MRNRLTNAILILAAYLLTCIAVFVGPYFEAAMTVSVGQPSPTLIVATRDVENILATESNRAFALAQAQEISPDAATLLDISLNIHTANNIYAFFDRLDAIRLMYSLWEIEQEEYQEIAYGQWQQLVEQWNQHLMQRDQMIADGIDPDGILGPSQPDAEFVFEGESFPLEDQFENIPVLLSSSQKEFLLTLSEEEYDDLYDALLETAEFVLESPGVVDASDQQVSINIHQKLVDLMNNYDAINAGHAIISAYLVPNRVFDEELFASIQQERAENYDRVMLLENELIVGEGERITEEHYAIMEALGMLEAEWTRDIVPLAGIYILIAFTILASCWFIYFYRQRIISHIKEALLLFTLYTAVMVALWALDGAGYYFMPILIFTMLVAMLIDSRTGVILNLGFTLIAYFVVMGSIQYMIFFMLSGTLVCLLARYTTERTKIMMVSLLVALFNFLLSVAITMAFEPHRIDYTLTGVALQGAFAALNGIFTVILAVGSLPLWEAVFGVVTPIKLLDLTNPTNPLMRRLTIEAPGTYHHSLIVANLAESAAYDIGANPHIARAGGYYHDIGKLKYPQYFAENITGVNPHDDMDPISSAQIIVSHIAYGLTLAAEHRLPQFLRDIINEHHGTSMIKYFYCKAKDAENPDEPNTFINEDDYRYPYLIPQSRESAVVMLADGVEAAVRSMMAQGKDVGNMQEMIDKMIKGKLTDGSLADSKLSIRDVDTISRSFYRILKGMYHERIPYPTDANSEVAMTRR